MSASDFRINRDVIIKAWGDPSAEKGKKLRWGNGNAYDQNWRSYDDGKRLWYDAGSKRGGRTVLELARLEQGKPPLKKGERLRGPEFISAWQYAFDRRWINDPPPEKPNGKGGDFPPIIATYPYQDEERTLLFEVVRFDTADLAGRFRQRQPDGKGGWLWSVKGVRRVLYRLPELLAAVKAGARILLCEGERDANTGMKLGYVTTTAPGGINKWQKTYDDVLRGANLIIVSDNDQQARDSKTGKPMFNPDGTPVLPGQDYAAKLARRLSRVAVQVRVIIPPVKDLSEWIEAAGGTREALDALIAAAPDLVKQLNPEPEPQENEDGGLEDRIALDFSAQHAADLRYVAKSNQWRQWVASRWQEESTLAAFDKARILCRAAGDAKAKTVAAVVTLARSDRRMAATTDQWDTNPERLNTPNEEG
jgi:putative DNA primase/helicase